MNGQHNQVTLKYNFQWHEIVVKFTLQVEIEIYVKKLQPGLNFINF